MYISCISLWKSFGRILAIPLQHLLLVVNGLGPTGTLAVAELVALGLQLLGQVVDFVAQGLQLLALGTYFFWRSAKLRWNSLVSPTGDLESNHCDLRGAGGS